MLDTINTNHDISPKIKILSSAPFFAWAIERISGDKSLNQFHDTDWRKIYLYFDRGCDVKKDFGNTSSENTYVVIGLGNIGDEYANTRHNMGFMAIDILASRLGINISRRKYQGYYGERAGMKGKRLYW